jgi:hypothetical protein
VGLFTYISSWFVMPLLGVLTIVALRPTRADAGLAAAAFVTPLAFSLPAWWSRTQVITDVFRRYQLSAAAHTSLLDFNLGERVSLYWDYFNPSFLFFAGGSDALIATGRAGVFLLPLAVFIPAGIYALIKRRSAATVLLLGGFIVGPLPIVIAMPEAPGHSIARALTMVIFGALIGGVGVQACLSDRRRAVRAVCVALLAIGPIQFATFLGDYVTDYQARSAWRFDPMATRDVMRDIITLDSQHEIPAIYLLNDGNNTAIRWQLATLRAQRLDLWKKVRYLKWPLDTADGMRTGSVIVLGAGDNRTTGLIEAGFSHRIDVAGVGDAGATILQQVAAR